MNIRVYALYLLSENREIDEANWFELTVWLPGSNDCTTFLEDFDDPATIESLFDASLDLLASHYTDCCIQVNVKERSLVHRGLTGKHTEADQLALKQNRWEFIYTDRPWPKGLYLGLLDGTLDSPTTQGEECDTSTS